MPTTGQRYGVGIGTGAAAGAAAGSALGPWGALVGGVVGGVGGAVSASMGESEEAKQRALIEERRKRERKAVLLNLLRQQATSGGSDTAYLDTLMGNSDTDYANLQEDRAFTAQHRIDPASFAPIAQYGTQAAGRIYDYYNTPQLPTAASPDPGLKDPRLRLRMEDF